MPSKRESWVHPLGVLYHRWNRSSLWRIPQEAGTPAIIKEKGQLRFSTQPHKDQSQVHRAEKYSDGYPWSQKEVNEVQDYANKSTILRADSGYEKLWMYVIDFVNYVNRRYLSVPSGLATATAIIVTCASFYITAAKLKYLPPFFFF